MTNEPNLKPCPICGEKPVMWKYNGGCTIECHKEEDGGGHRVQAFGRNIKKAIEIWQRMGGIK